MPPKRKFAHIISDMPSNTKPRIAIIGGGPTGICTSRSLVLSGFEIDLIEAGGVDSESMELSTNDYIFETRSLIPNGVHRLGGGSNYWIGRIGEFLPLDFEAMPGLRNESFPISYDDLQPYYLQAFEMLTEEGKLDSDLVLAELNRLRISAPGNLEFRIIRYANKNFFRATLNLLNSNPNFRLLLNQKCLSIKRVISAGGFESYLCNFVSNGKEFQKEYDVVVLCCGAMQSPALLLNSPDLLSVGNSRLVGAFLMEHFDGFAGEIYWNKKTHSKILKRISLNRNRETKGSNGIGLGIKISELLRRELASINLHLEVIPKQRLYFFDPEKNFRRVNMFKVPYLGERIIRKIYSELSKMVLLLFGKAVYSVWVKAEILPTIDSRIAISKLDGDYKTHYGHKVSEKSRQEFVRALEILQRELSLSKVGEFIIKPSILNGSDQILEGVNWHPMGTLRMGIDSGSSVCDSNLKLHGSANVYIADASVFPAGSNANPTFTALALGLRLSNQIKEKFGE